LICSSEVRKQYTRNLKKRALKKFIAVKLKV
jgi:hypothetical protein